MKMLSRMAKPFYTASVNRIAHPTDLTDTSNGALAWATLLAKANKAELLLLHVVPPPTPIFEFESPTKAQAELKLSVLLTELKMNDVRARGYVLCGTKSIDSQIVRAARLEKIDLIVLGTHARTGISRALMGSVASRVIARAYCPVLVVRGGSTRENSSRPNHSQSDEYEKKSKFFI
jgi:nucleotide-binding universal stress UspA family protein